MTTQKSVDRMLAKARELAAKALDEQERARSKEPDQYDRYGVAGKPQGQPVNIHRGTFQRKNNEDDWAMLGRGIASAPPVLSLDSGFRLRDATGRM